MRFARPTFAIASPVFTFALVAWLLTTAFSSLAQPTTRTYVADGGPGTVAPAAPLAPSATATTATLEATANLSEFYQLIELAGLRTRLRRPTEAMTVFAPTNAAMANLSAPVRERLHQVGTPVLKSLVRTHLVPGIITADQLTDGREIITLDGRKLRVKRQPDGTVLLDGVYRVRDTGQRTTNGIVYTLDTVIVP